MVGLLTVAFIALGHIEAVEISQNHSPNRSLGQYSSAEKDLEVHRIPSIGLDSLVSVEFT